MRLRDEPIKVSMAEPVLAHQSQAPPNASRRGFRVCGPCYSRASMGIKESRTISRSLSVRSRIIIAFVSLTLLSVAVVSWIGYVSARQSLRALSERQLMGLQRSKAAMVKA